MLLATILLNFHTKKIIIIMKCTTTTITYNIIVFSSSSSSSYFLLLFFFSSSLSSARHLILHPHTMLQVSNLDTLHWIKIFPVHSTSELPSIQASHLTRPDMASVPNQSPKKDNASSAKFKESGSSVNMRSAFKRFQGAVSRESLNTRSGHIVSYYDYGPKSDEQIPLVCLHGIESNMAIFFKQIVSLAARGYRVIFFLCLLYMTIRCVQISCSSALTS